MPNAIDLRRQLPGIGFVVLLHIAVIAVFLNAVPKYHRLVSAERETILYLAALPKAPQPTAHPALRMPGSVLPKIFDTGKFGPTVAPPSDINGLGLSLFSCAPENLNNLSFEDREKCHRASRGFAAIAPNTLPRSHVRYTARWTYELARKKAPLSAPCFSSQGFNPLAIVECLGDVLGNGYDTTTPERYDPGKPEGYDPDKRDK